MLFWFPAVWRADKLSSRSVTMPTRNFQPPWLSGQKKRAPRGMMKRHTGRNKFIRGRQRRTVGTKIIALPRFYILRGKQCVNHYNDRQWWRPIKTLVIPAVSIAGPLRLLAVIWCRLFAVPEIFRMRKLYFIYYSFARCCPDRRNDKFQIKKPYSMQKKQRATVTIPITCYLSKFSSVRKGLSIYFSS